MLARAQTTAPADEHEAVVKLDSVVVSAGHHDQTAFDLAQGTAILAGAELQERTQDTLGETLSATPGVNSTYYGPGASRPLIRGLGGDRIRVLQNSVGALDASNVSPDHNPAIEPLFASRIEVLRGPSTLLYGSSAVGGAVNVIDNRIPLTRVERPVSGVIELRGFGDNDERTGVAAIGAGRGDFAVQVDALTQHTGDLAIPGLARIDAAAPSDQPAGRVPNSALSTQSGSVGATWFGSTARFGAAVSRYETDYGVPVDEPISISMRQTRLDLDGAITEPLGIFSGATARFGLGDYTHSEIADHTTTNTTFKNKAWEGRLELPHVWTDTFGGTFGAQVARSDFAAVGEEVVTPPSVTQSEALFALEEWKLAHATLQAGARVEDQTITLGEVPPGLPAAPGYAAHSGEKSSLTGASGSLGLVLYPAKDWSAGLSLAYSERLPTAQERFSNGPHGGTGAWELGTAALGKEKSIGLDLSLRKRAGFVTGSIGAFVNRFGGYVFEQMLPSATIPPDVNPEGLTVYQFIAKDSLFRGAEAELTFHLAEGRGWHLHLDLMSDYVRASQTTDDENLPRIPPLRYGAGLHFENDAWNVGVEARHTVQQDQVAPGETITPGYTLLNASVSYALARGRYEIFARGTNLANAEARVHASFLKDFVPLGGRGVSAGVRLIF